MTTLSGAEAEAVPPDQLGAPGYLPQGCDLGP
jgi:hypothetical protein